MLSSIVIQQHHPHSDHQTKHKNNEHRTPKESRNCHCIPVLQQYVMMEKNLHTPPSRSYGMNSLQMLLLFLQTLEDGFNGQLFLVVSDAEYLKATKETKPTVPSKPT